MTQFGLNLSQDQETEIRKSTVCVCTRRQIRGWNKLTTVIRMFYDLIEIT